jgi:hypothetical protein
MESWTCGPHLFEFEPPDIFHCHVRGPVQENEAKESVRLSIDELGKRGIRVFFVAQLEASDSGGPFTSGAKSYLGTAKPDWKAILIVGGNPVVRFAAGVVARAQSLLSDRKMPTLMVKSMDEARERIAELRAKEAARAARSAAS